MIQYTFEKLLVFSINHDILKFYIFLSRFNKFMTIWESKIQIEINKINKLDITFPEKWLKELDHKLECKIQKYENKKTGIR